MRWKARVLVLVACLVLAAGACDAGDHLGSVLVVPAEVPDGLTLRGGCHRDGTTGPAASVLWYRGDGRYKSEVRIESAFLRLFAVDVDERASLDDPEFSGIDDVLADAEPGSRTETEVRGRTGTLFSMRSAKDAASRPALAWTDGNLMFWISGEGLDQASVLGVAESLRQTSTEEFRALTDGQQC